MFFISQKSHLIRFLTISIIVSIMFSGRFMWADTQSDTSSAPRAEKVTMVCTRPEVSYFGKWLYLVFAEAFKRIDMELVFEHYPAKRCSYLAKEGLVDGDLCRIYSYNETYTNLLRVDESIATVRWVAFSKDTRLHMDKWEDFKGTDFKVDYRHGLLKVENKLSRFVRKENLSTVNEVNQGLKKLASGRSDIYVDVEETVKQYLVTDDFRNSKIRNIGVLEEETLHAFLHEKNASFVPKLSSSLKEMKQEGLLHKYKTLVEEEIKSIIID